MTRPRGIRVKAGTQFVAFPSAGRIWLLEFRKKRSNLFCVLQHVSKKQLEYHKQNWGFKIPAGPLFYTWTAHMHLLELYPVPSFDIILHGTYSPPDRSF